MFLAGVWIEMISIYTRLKPRETHLFDVELMIIILSELVMCCRRQRDGMRRVSRQKTRLID